MNKEFANWLSLSGDLSESADTGRVVCPSCGKGPIDFRFVGRIADRIGYLDVWCRSCLRGIHISRVKVPDEKSMLNLDGSLDEISAQIPTFTQVLPD